MPLYRNKVWNGKINLFSLNEHTLYCGLTEYINRFAEERKYNVVYDPKITLKENFSIQEAEEFAKSLQLQTKGKDIEARDFQIVAFAKGIRNKRQLILSPTASGKSLIGYLFIRKLEEKKGLIIVPTISLVEQLFSDFQDYSTKNKWNVEKNVHRIYSGKDKDSPKNLIISTWQSIYKLPKQYFEQFDYIIGDEAHTFKAKSLTHIMSSAINAAIRIGLTGSLDNTETHRLVLEGLFGPEKKMITTEELIARKQLSKFTIKALVLKHPELDCKAAQKMAYNEEFELVIGSKKRNTFIKNLALSLTGNTLILYSRVDTHGKILYNDILDKVKDSGRNVYFVYADIPVEERERIRKAIETDTNAILVASYGTFSTGINITNLHNIIFASPFKSKIRNLQSIGRGLRIGNNKKEATLYDIVDDLRVGKKDNFLLKHFRERLKTYIEEKFPYKIYKIDFTK